LGYRRELRWHARNYKHSGPYSGGVYPQFITSVATQVASDFNGSQHDILWQDDNGSIGIWDNGQTTGAQLIANAGVVTSDWHIAGTGDFDGNGHTDILWQSLSGITASPLAGTWSPMLAYCEAVGILPAPATSMAMVIPTFFGRATTARSGSRTMASPPAHTSLAR